VPLPSPRTPNRRATKRQLALVDDHGMPMAGGEAYDRGQRIRGKGEKLNKRFNGEEAANLVEGVGLYGLGAWETIRKHNFEESNRSCVDLKDKWRNLCTAAGRPANFKFRSNYFTPELLAKVRTVQAEAERRGKHQKDAAEKDKKEKRAQREAAEAQLVLAAAEVTEAVVVVVATAGAVAGGGD